MPLNELEKRWEIDSSHKYFKEGIDEKMTIDNSKHSLFGASKVAADILAQEYGKYFNMNIGIFRGGCLTGPNHSGAQLHGFLSYLIKCCITGDQYTVFGYKGKQVRDNIHSWDLVNMFWHFYQNPRKGEVYNAGGSRHSNCSMQEALELAENLVGKKMNYNYSESNRIGDHIWYISDVSKFKAHFPNWDYKHNLNDIFEQIVNNAAKSFYISRGKHSVPIVIRLVVGRGWGQGPEHAQSMENIFSSIPGLKVVIPAFPNEAKELMINSLRKH